MRDAVLTTLLNMATRCREENQPILNRDTFLKCLQDGCAATVDVKKIKPAQLKLIEKTVRKPSEKADICYDKRKRSTPPSKNFSGAQVSLNFF